MDDKVAQKLLGDSFKRQLQFDGTYSSITVICSKADDISLTEALKVLPEDGEAKQLFAHAEVLEAARDEIADELDTMKERNFELREETDECNAQIRCLKSAIRRAANEDDFVLFSPGSSRKRPSRGAASKPHKRQRPSHGSDSEDADPT